MDRFHKKVWFISILLTVNILMLVACKSNNIDETNLAYSSNINSDNAKVLSIKDVNSQNKRPLQPNFHKMVERFRYSTISWYYLNRPKTLGSVLL